MLIAVDELIQSPSILGGKDVLHSIRADTGSIIDAFTAIRSDRQAGSRH